MDDERPTSIADLEERRERVPIDLYLVALALMPPIGLIAILLARFG